VLAISGRKRREIHSRWANLREHSGSFVDARTGEPYDGSYGTEWRNLLAADRLAESGGLDASSESWSAKAGKLVGELQDVLAKGGENMKETFQSLASKIGSVGTTTWSASAGYAKTAGDTATAMAHRVSSGATSVASGVCRLGGRAQAGVTSAYAQSRRYASDSIENYPLAVGGAALGIGLVAGLVLPRSRREDRWMGAASTELKHRAKDTAERAVERGKEVASATAAAAMDEAEKQGMMPGQLVERARETLTKAQQTAQEKLKEASHQVGEKTSQVAERVSDVAPPTRQPPAHTMSSQKLTEDELGCG
jgi:hypothetical protein